jgi:hypothetical protein
MEAIRDLATFRSARFTPVLPEECQVNPGCYGAELAFWLCTRLYSEKGVATSYPDYEDWGWLLSYSTGAGDEFALHCGNVEGARDEWLISLRRFGRRLFGRDKPDFERAGSLVRAVRELLEAEDGVTELRWLYDHPSACPPAGPRA